MISNLLNVLKNNPKLYAWNVKVVSKDSYQLYFIKQQLDMNREVITDEYSVSIFVKEEGKNKSKLGTATFKISPAMTNEEVEDKINEQISLCKYTLNEAYLLPKKVNLKPVSKEVGFDGHSLKDAAFIAADALFEADRYKNGFINSSEIYINYIETRFFDSNGNVFLYTTETGQIEFVVTWQEKQHEVELYKFIEFDKLDSAFIQSQANQLLLEAGLRIKALPTPSLNNCKVLLHESYVKDFFWYYANKANTDYIYQHMSDYSVGRVIQNKDFKNDIMTIRLEGTMKNSTIGAPFDDEGISLKKLQVIEKGVVKNLWGSNAKSQYLNKPVNGTYKNIIVNAGTLQKEELENETYLEIVSLSDFSIDPITGDFGSEIRLAYLYNKNKDKVVVSGGSISGNVNDCLDNIRFTNETVQVNNYFGPKKIFLDKVKVNKG